MCIKKQAFFIAVLDAQGIASPKYTHLAWKDLQLIYMTYITQVKIFLHSTYTFYTTPKIIVGFSFPSFCVGGPHGVSFSWTP